MPDFASISRALFSGFNRASFWRLAPMRVWGQRLVFPTADRLLYAGLHRAGLMGRADRQFLEKEIRPGMTVVDVGANVGLYALWCSERVGPRGKVLAFEPDAALFAALDRARLLNRRDNLRVFRTALGDRTEKRTLNRSLFNSGDNRLSGSGSDRNSHNGGGNRATAEISVARGDDFLLDEPLIDFIKIDVQGWELHALKGMRDAIERSSSLQIYFEFCPRDLREAGTAPEALFGFLESHGFTILRDARGQWTRVPSCADLLAGMKPTQYLNLWAKKRP